MTQSGALYRPELVFNQRKRQGFVGHRGRPKVLSSCSVLMQVRYISIADVERAQTPFDLRRLQSFINLSLVIAQGSDFQTVLLWLLSRQLTGTSLQKKLSAPLVRLPPFFSGFAWSFCTLPLCDRYISSELRIVQLSVSHRRPFVCPFSFHTAPIFPVPPLQPAVRRLVVRYQSNYHDPTEYW